MMTFLHKKVDTCQSLTWTGRPSIIWPHLIHFSFLSNKGPLLVLEPDSNFPQNHISVSLSSASELSSFVFSCPGYSPWFSHKPYVFIEPSWPPSPHRYQLSCKGWCSLALKLHDSVPEFFLCASLFSSTRKGFLLLPRIAECSELQ